MGIEWEYTILIYTDYIPNQDRIITCEYDWNMIGISPNFHDLRICMGIYIGIESSNGNMMNMIGISPNFHDLRICMGIYIGIESSNGNGNLVYHVFGIFLMGA